MAVYVDDMYTKAMGQFNRMKMSHMIASTLEELHEMAETIGLKKKWFQDTPSGPHYDVSMSKRKLALQNGAIPITLRQCSKMCWVRRVTGKLPPYRKAEKRWQKFQDKLRRPPIEHPSQYKRKIHRIRL